ncbi:TIGR02922 family protein [Colwelliaceae bacterium BS250]|jgi:uncharacterized protein (TIGR02922 family)
MENSTPTKVTIFYYDLTTLALMHSVETFPRIGNGRVIISDEFKKNKSIIQVCEGEVIVLNKVGDRVND